MKAALLAVALLACGSRPPPAPTLGPAGYADVLAVEATGPEGAYVFEVTVRSPDTGCAHYADWWEVLTAEGELQFRKTLEHSHTTEQPFKRAGSPVSVGVDQPVYVRAHMSDTGYGGRVLRGSVGAGFVDVGIMPPTFASAADSMRPRPPPCAK